MPDSAETAARPPFIFKAKEHIDRTGKGAYEARLLARGDRTEVIQTVLPAEATFYLDSSEEWQGFEFVYIIDGELSYLGSDPAMTLGPGDYVARQEVRERSWFKAVTNVTLLSMSSRPAFSVMKEEAEEFYQLARQIEADEYMDGHCKRLEKLALLTGKKLDLTGEQLGNLSDAAFFHDLGKSKVPRKILQKPGQLTEGEWSVMKRHTVWGREMLEQKESLGEAAKIVEQTHERVDGSGYPRGLRGDEIAIEAKIITVVDAYDAMTTDRPYQKALAKEDAIRELKRGSGSQFDRRVVEAFLQVMDEDDSFDMYRNMWFDEDVARLKQREAFLEIVEEVLSGKNLRQILNSVVQAITANTPFQRAALALYDRPIQPQSVDRGEIVHTASAGLSPEEEAELESNPLSPPERKKIFQEEFKISRSYYISNDKVPWRERSGQIKSRARSHPEDTWHPDDYLFIPMYVGDRVVGIVSVDDPADRKAPTTETLEPIEMFANLAALAIEKAQHIQELSEFHKRLEGIYELSKRFTEVDDVNDVIEQSIEIIHENFPYDYISILLVEEGELLLKAQRGDDVCPLEVGGAMPRERGVTTWVAKHKEPALIPDVGQDPRYIGSVDLMGSELAVPIGLSEEVLGVFNIESHSKSAYDEEDVRLLRALADQVAVALSSLRRQHRLQELATHDPLTHVYNRHYFSELIEREKARASRSGHAISLVLIDFDDFHTINDRYGHLEGDRVLREATALFRSSVREEDAVIRYGGDEFLIVMPGTPYRKAERLSDRLRQRLGEEDFGLPVRLSISTGVSTWQPEGEQDFEQVLEEADQWMYRRYKRQEAKQ